MQAFRNACASSNLWLPDVIKADGAIHRFDIGGKKSRNGWYSCVEKDGVIVCGIAGNWAVSGNEPIVKYNSKSKDLTAEDKKEIAKLRKEMAEKAEENAKKTREMIRSAISGLKKEYIKPSIQHGYITKKMLRSTYNAKAIASAYSYSCNDDETPMRKVPQTALLIEYETIHGETTAVQMIQPDGQKFFMNGSELRGAMHWITDKVSTSRIIVCEGWATGCTIHEATGETVVVAMNADNLKNVIEILKSRYPDAEIVIAADNDHKTKGNPGLSKASEFAREFGCKIVFPREIEGTDFNDMAVEFGIDAVKDEFSSNISTFSNVKSYLLDMTLEDKLYDSNKNPTAPIVLGYNHDEFFYIGANSHQIFSLSASAHSKLNLLSIAPLSYWEENFFGSQGVDWTRAADAMITACHRRGICDKSSIVGRGVYIDNDHIVFHRGDKLVVDGNEVDVTAAGLDYTYEKSTKIIMDCKEELTVEEGADFVRLLKLFPWKNPESMPILFAGWIATASIVGALAWRPHYNLTGPRGVGKTYMFDNIVKKAIPIALTAGSGTTEPGVRNSLGSQAFPVIFDEAEKQEESDSRRMQTILNLARAATSEEGARIIKGKVGGGSTEYLIRSSFIFGSINDVAAQAADQSRMVVGVLHSKPEEEMSAIERVERAENFRKIQIEVSNVINRDFGSKMFNRMLRMVRTIRNNSFHIADAISEMTGDRRIADTIASPFAGFLAIISDMTLDLESARRVVKQYPWLVKTAEKSRTDADHDRAINHILEHVISYVGTSDIRVDASISSLISKIRRNPDDSNREKDALITRGIKIEGSEMLLVKKHSAISTIYRNTPWDKSWESVISQSSLCIASERRPSIHGIRKYALALDMNKLFVDEVEDVGSFCSDAIDDEIEGF